MAPPRKIPFGTVADRNQFRVQLTGVIECTAVLFEHLVELTQGLDEVGYSLTLGARSRRCHIFVTWRYIFFHRFF